MSSLVIDRLLTNSKRSWSTLGRRTGVLNSPFLGVKIISAGYDEIGKRKKVTYQFIDTVLKTLLSTLHSQDFSILTYFTAEVCAGLSSKAI